MPKNDFFLKKLVLLLVLFSTYTYAQVSGTVFRDFNSNGTKDNTATFNEIGLAGITVTAYDATGSAVGTVTSATDGTYMISGIGVVGDLRIEFSGWVTMYYPSFAGGTSVQFVTAPATGVDFAVNSPLDYSQSNPNVVLPYYRSGDPADASLSNLGVLSSFNYTSTGTPPSGYQDIATVAQIGSVWGVAYHRSKKELYMSSLVKRHVGLGPSGIGAIYKRDMTTNTISTLYDFGSLAGTISSNSARGLTVPGSPSVDQDGWAMSGKIGLGDIDISGDGNTLWAVNLNDGKLYAVNTNNPAAGSAVGYTIPSAGCTATVSSVTSGAYDLGRTSGTPDPGWTALNSSSPYAKALDWNMGTVPSNSTVFPTSVFENIIGGQSKSAISIPVANGVYSIEIGIYNPNKTHTIYIEDIQKVANYTAPADPVVLTYTATVTDGRLTVYVDDPTGTVWPSLSAIRFNRTSALPDPTAIQRPWAVKVHNDGTGEKVYVGVVCSAEETGIRADLTASVMVFDPLTTTWSGPVLSFPLDYSRQKATVNFFEVADWRAWTNSYTQMFFNGFVNGSSDGGDPIPMPILSDIEFDVYGDMIVAFTDRAGLMFGLQNIPPQPPYSPASSQLTYLISAGDILRAGKNNNSSWTIENNGVTNGIGGTKTTSSTATVAGPGGKEFYWGEYYGIGSVDHLETSQGALALLPGTGEVLNVSMDADNTGGLYAGGVNALSNTDGSYNRGTNIYTNITPYTFGKAHGLGDVEILSDPPPLEIGNRVWTDTDSDGVQDANEAGIDGVTVLLFEGSTQVGTTTTANGGQWYFNDSNTTGGLKPNTAYTVRVQSNSFPSGQTLTLANNDGSTNGDVRDNDAALVGGNAEIAYTTGSYGQNDHTLDIGFRIIPDLSLTKTVSNAIVALNGTVTFTLTLTNDNGVDATGVVVTDVLPAGVTFVSSSDPTNVVVSGNTLTWNVGNMLGTDAPKMLDITVTANSEGSFVNNAEITDMNETDTDSTPNNDVAGEDDQDQACFSVPVTLCSDSPTASITITATTATTYQWYVSTDNGATYTPLSGETSQTLVVNNTLMGGNNVTKYFKVAYNGSPIMGTCGDVMCCPVIITTQTCVVCPVPKCITIGITKH